MINQAQGVMTVSGTDAIDSDVWANAHGEKLRAKRLYIVPRVSVATHASNYITTTVSIGGTTIATHTTNSSGGSALTADTPLVVSLSGTGTSLELAAGSAVKVAVAKAGTGPAYDFDVAIGFEVQRA